MVIKQLDWRFAQKCADLERLLFPEESTWTRDIFAVELAHPDTIYIGAFDGDELIAFAGLIIFGPREDSECDVHTFGVNPHYQHRGIGGTLMAQLCHIADRNDAPMFIEVRTDNKPAIALCKKYDFSMLATRKYYYQPSGDDAFTMSRASPSERLGFY